MRATKSLKRLSVIDRNSRLYIRALGWSNELSPCCVITLSQSVIHFLNFLDALNATGHTGVRDCERPFEVKLSYGSSSFSSYVSRTLTSVFATTWFLFHWPDRFQLATTEATKVCSRRSLERVRQSRMWREDLPTQEIWALSVNLRVRLLLRRRLLQEFQRPLRRRVYQQADSRVSESSASTWNLVPSARPTRTTPLAWFPS